MWSSGWESACRCRGHGFDPWSRNHATEQLNPCIRTPEPPLETIRCNKRKCAHSNQDPVQPKINK